MFAQAPGSLIAHQVLAPSKATSLHRIRGLDIRQHWFVTVIHHYNVQFENPYSKNPSRGYSYVCLTLSVCDELKREENHRYHSRNFQEHGRIC